MWLWIVGRDAWLNSTGNDSECQTGPDATVGRPKRNKILARAGIAQEKGATKFPVGKKKEIGPNNSVNVFNNRKGGSGRGETAGGGT